MWGVNYFSLPLVASCARKQAWPTGGGESWSIVRLGLKWMPSWMNIKHPRHPHTHHLLRLLCHRLHVCLCWIILWAAYCTYTAFKEERARVRDCNKILISLYRILHACFHPAAGSCSRTPYTIPLKSCLWHEISSLMSIPGGSSPCSQSPSPVCHMSTEGLWEAPPHFSQMQILTSYVCWGYSAYI